MNTRTASHGCQTVTGFIQLGGCRLEFTEWAPPQAQVERPADLPNCTPSDCDVSGTTIVLMHEGLGCVAMWREFPALLCAHTGHGVFAYSRQGYGRSTACEVPRPLDYMQLEAQTTLPAVLERFGDRPVVLFGHSDGASIAAVYAALPASLPSRARLHGIILMAPHFFTESVALREIALARERWRQGDLRNALRKYHGDNVDCAFNGWCNAWLDPDFVKFDLRPMLSSISVPALLVQGTHDRYGTRAQLSCAKEMIGRDYPVCEDQVTELLIPECDHSPHIEKPESLLAGLGPWFEKHAVWCGGV